MEGARQAQSTGKVWVLTPLALFPVPTLPRISSANHIFSIMY